MTRGRKGLLVRIGRADQPLVPFDEPRASLPLLDLPLAEHQAREAARAGLELVEVAPGAPAPSGTEAALLPDVVFTAETLTALLRAAEGGEGLRQAAVRKGTPLFDSWRPSCRARGSTRTSRSPSWRAPSRAGR